MAKSTVAVRFTGHVASLKRSIDEVDGKFGGLKKSAVVGLAGASTAVAAFAGSSVKAYTEAETAQAGLTAAFEKFPQLAGGNIDALRDLNSELAKKTQFDDDATASGQAVLAGFGLTADQLAQVTPLLQDYAAKTGKDLPTAAQDLGKAVLGQGRALKGIGLNFKDTGDAAGNFDQLVGGLTDKVGGFAEVAGDTAAGKAQILGNQFGELQESVGQALVPVLTRLADVLVDDVLPIIEKVGAWFADHKPVLIAVAAVIGTGLVAAFTAWAIAAGQAAVATLAATWPILAIGAAIAALVAGIIYAYTHWDFFRTAVDAVASFITGTLWPALQSVASFFTETLVPAIATAINWIRDNWQLLLAILTGPIGAAVAIITTHWDTIRNAAMAVFNWVRDNWQLLLAILTGPIGAAVLIIKTHWDTLKDGITGVYNWFRDKINAIAQFFAELPNRIRAQVDRILNQLDRLLGPLDEIAGKIADVAGGVGGAIGNAIPFLATGAHNFRGGLAVVGEDGPELVNLPRGSDVIPNGQFGISPFRGGLAGPGGGTVVNLNISIPPTMDAGAAGQSITEALAAYVRRNGANDLRQILGV